MLRPATLIAAVLLGAAALAADSPRWVEVGGGTWEPPALFAQIESALRPVVTAAAKGRGRMPDWKSYTF
jgi:hypothetical protein